MTDFWDTATHSIYCTVWFIQYLFEKEHTNVCRYTQYHVIEELTVSMKHKACVCLHVYRKPSLFGMFFRNFDISQLCFIGGILMLIEAPVHFLPFIFLLYHLCLFVNFSYLNLLHSLV